MTDLVRLNQEFEGNPLTTLFYKNMPCWITREVGTAMGYARGGERLVTNITNDWQDEFIEGHDFALIEGKELADFKALLEPTTESVGGRASHLLLLFEPGLHLALAKTNKPVGRRLRRFIADEVMPQIARDGAYIPNRTLKETEASRRLALAEAKEARLDRQFKTKAMEKLVEALKRAEHVSNDVVMTYEICTAEEATGECLSTLKPHLEDPWQTPTQIAERMGVSPQRVGRVVTELGLR